eukprot:scpid1600/ scgid25124/ Protein furry homolog-like; ALL1-fused gene from chromosome 4p12 protein
MSSSTSASEAKEFAAGATECPRWYGLPWESNSDGSMSPVPLACRPSSNVTPGEVVLRTLLAEFTSRAAKKLEVVNSQPLDRPLARYLQTGEDVQFDQTLLSLSAISEHCLPSVLRTVLDWYAKQMKSSGKRERGSVGKAGGSQMRDHQRDRRDLCVDFIFCRVLIEVLTKLSVHPTPDVLIQFIIETAFEKFKERNFFCNGPNAANGDRIADLYAEVIGVLSYSRFTFVRNKLKDELAMNPGNETTINLIRGLSFAKVKMYPVEALEEWFRFLKELGNIYLTIREKDVRSAFAAMFVEILGPVAAAVKLEVNLPVCKSFVDLMYTQTCEMAKKGGGRQAMAAFPLVTILLSISQRSFFLANWHYFLTMCLTNLKHRDPRMQRVSLDSIYRLLWVYMIRVKCESNTATQSRLRTIVDCLFPRNSRSVVPRETSLTIFVKIVHFIAQEKLDFAMQEIIFELLSINQRPNKAQHPERTNIGLRAFLVIIDSLEKQEGAPPMPPTVGTMPSGNTLRTKKHFLNTVLTDQVAKKIGIFNYYQSVRRALDRELQSLDLQVGRQLVMTNSHFANKDQEEILTGDRKPKIELYRTCIAAIPRCIPEGVSKQDLVDHLSRLTIHLDSELRGLAFTSLQTMVMELPDWREEVVRGFVSFMSKDVPDAHPLILESELRCLVQFLTHWKTAASQEKAPKPSADSETPSSDIGPETLLPSSSTAEVLHYIEGFSLAVMCSTRPTTRKLAMIILKEVRTLHQLLGLNQNSAEETVMTVIEKIASSVVHKCLSLLPEKTRNNIVPLSSIDLVWLAEQPSNILGLTAHSSYPTITGSSAGPTSSDGSKASTMGGVAPSTSGFSLDANNVVSYGDSHVDLWSACLAGLLERENLPQQCPSAVQYSRPSVFQRLMAAYSNIDPGFSVSDPSKGSMRSMKKPPNPTDLCLWHNYLVFACRVIPPTGHDSLELLSSTTVADISPTDKVDAKGGKQKFTPAALFHWLVPLVRSEVPEIREAVVTALGYCNPLVFGDMVTELQLLVETLDRGKRKNRHKQNPLRLNISRIYSFVAANGAFRNSPSGTLDASGNLLRCHLDYIEAMRLFLLQENEKVGAPYDQMRLCFCTFISELVNSIEQGVLSSEMRGDLFFLFGSWCGQLSITTSELATATRIIKQPDLHAAALKAICSLLICGPIFNSSALEPHGYLLRWISKGLERPEEKTQNLIRSALEILMLRNTDLPVLLEWIIEKCYIGSRLVVDGCFHALARSFAQNPNYPCDMVAILNVALFMTSDTSYRVRERAAQLLQILDRRYFSSDSDASSCIMTSLAGAHSLWQCTLSERLARSHPELTLPMLSELFMRFESAKLRGQRCILQYMVPWLRNIELEMSTQWPMASHGFPRQSAVVVCEDSWRTNVPLPSGSASVEATEMVLNNLFYITVKYEDVHSKEIEDCWANLCKYHYNIPTALAYVVMLAGYSGSPELLHYAKKVVVYIGRTAPNVIIGELMKELESMDPLTATIDQIAVPPYYIVQPRLPTVSRNSSCCQRPSTTEDTRTLVASPDNLHVNRREFSRDKHTDAAARAAKRYSAPPMVLDAENATDAGVHFSSSLPAGGVLDEDEVTNATCHMAPSSVDPCRVAVSSSLVTIKAQQSADVLEEDVEDTPVRSVQPDVVLTNSIKTPKRETGLSPGPATATNSASSFRTPVGSPNKVLCGPLPMPTGGGYYAPLTDFLLPNTHTALVYRCNFALMLLTELVVDRCAIKWNIFLPKLLHMAFLGLDHVKPLVYEHCKRLLTNLVMVLTSDDNQCSAGHYMVSSGLRSPSEDSLSSLAGLQSILSIDTQLGLRSDDEDSAGSGGSHNSTVRTHGRPTSSASTNAHTKAKSLVEYIALRERRRPLWSYEEITSRVVSIKSAEHLKALLSRVMTVLSELPGPALSERWAKESLRWATCCSSRHYAGRSFQLCRALHLPMSWSSLVRILLRLCDSAADASADVQGYAMEIYLTIEAMVDNDIKDLLSDDDELSSLRSAYRHTDCFGPQTHGEASNAAAAANGLETVLPPSLNLTVDPDTDGANGGQDGIPERRRHGSDAVLYQREGAVKSGFLSPGVGRGSSGSPLHFNLASVNAFSDSKINHSYRERSPSLTRATTSSDRLQLQCRVFWISVALLESDYEHEFLFGLKLLGKVMDVVSLGDETIHEQLISTLLDSNWPSFPGIQAFVLKGLTSSNTFELSVQMLSRLTEHTRCSVVDMTQTNGLAVNIISLLPYLCVHFDSPDDICYTAVTKIVHECEADSQLRNLGMLFELYLTGRYTKQVSSWIRSICVRLREACHSFVLACLPLLTGLLVHCDELYTVHIVSIIGQLIQLHSMDMQSPDSSLSLESRVALNQQILRIVSSFVQGNVGLKCSNELREILQIAVETSATIAQPASSNMSFFCRPSELPGPTLDVQVDLTKAGRVRSPSGASWSAEREASQELLSALAAVSSTGGDAKSTDGDVAAEAVLNVLRQEPSSCWKKPHLCQSRVRDRLACVLRTCMSKTAVTASPSVVFGSDLTPDDVQGDISSSEDVMASDSHSLLEHIESLDHNDQQLYGVLREFDFLDDLEGGEDSDNVSVVSKPWGSLRRHLSLEDISDSPFGRSHTSTRTPSLFSSSMSSLAEFEQASPTMSSENVRIPQSDLPTDRPALSRAESSDAVPQLSLRHVSTTDKVNRASSDHEVTLGKSKLALHSVSRGMIDLGNGSRVPRDDRRPMSEPSSQVSSPAHADRTDSSAMMASPEATASSTPRHNNLASSLDESLGDSTTAETGERCAQSPTTCGEHGVPNSSSAHDQTSTGISGITALADSDFCSGAPSRDHHSSEDRRSSMDQFTSSHDSSAASSTHPSPDRSAAISVPEAVPAVSSTSASYSRLKSEAYSPANVPLPPSPAKSVDALSYASPCHSPFSPTSVSLPPSRGSVASPLHSTAEAAAAAVDDASVDRSATASSPSSISEAVFAARATAATPSRAGSVGAALSRSRRVTGKGGSVRGLARRDRGSGACSPSLYSASSGLTPSVSSPAIVSLSSSSVLCKHRDSTGSKSSINSPEISEVSADNQQDESSPTKTSSESSPHPMAIDSVHTVTSLDEEDGQDVVGDADAPMMIPAAAAGGDVDHGADADIDSYDECGEDNGRRRQQLSSSMRVQSASSLDAEMPPPPVKSFGESSFTLATNHPTSGRDLVSPLCSEFICIPADEVDEVWRAHVSTVISDTTAAAAVNSVFIFTRLLKAYRRRLGKLTRDACQVVADPSSEITSVFLRFVDVMQSEVMCPFIYVDTDLLLSSSVFDHFKFCVVEINENISAYTQRRDSVLERLDSIRVKLRRPVSGMSSDSMDSTMAEMTRKDFLLQQDIYKLHFQMLLLLSSYRKMLDVLNKARDAADVTDLSFEFTKQVTSVLAVLKNCEWKLPEGHSFFQQNPDPYSLCRRDAIGSVMDALSHDDAVTALNLIRLYRNKWPHDAFGASDEDDCDVLVTFVAKMLTQNSTNNIMIYQGGARLDRAYTSLMTINMDTIKLIKQAEAAAAL